MTEIRSFQDVIGLWPSKEAMAADLSSLGATATGVSKWWQRDSIPAEWWEPILATGKASDAGLTAEFLTKLVARKPESVELDEARA